MSRVTDISALVIWVSSPACRAVNHYRDNAITMLQRDKNARELKLANAGNYRHADASA